METVPAIVTDVASHTTAHVQVEKALKSIAVVCKETVCRLNCPMFFKVLCVESCVIKYGWKQI